MRIWRRGKIFYEKAPGEKCLVLTIHRPHRLHFRFCVNMAYSLIIVVVT